MVDGGVQRGGMSGSAPVGLGLGGGGAAPRDAGELGRAAAHGSGRGGGVKIVARREGSWPLARAHPRCSQSGRPDVRQHKGWAAREGASRAQERHSVPVGTRQAALLDDQARAGVASPMSGIH